MTKMKDGPDRLPPWTVEVDVYVYGEECEPPFKIESFLQASENGDLVFRNRGRHGFNVRFNLIDETGEGWEFPNQAQDALWSSEGVGCPPAGCGQWKEFEAHHVQGQKILVVRNLNETETKFGYTLRITKDNGASFRNLDPGGDNLNGNWD